MQFSPLLRLRALLSILLFLMGFAPAGQAETIRLAVASNFRDAMEQLEARFEADTGFEVSVSYGSTGKLYAQISNGAPFHLFLAADQERPKQLEDDNLSVLGTRMTYAEGRLVLWSLTHDSLDAELLERGDIEQIAIANPDLAPYGRAALEVLENLSPSNDLPKAIMGENVGQAVAFVYTGNVKYGLVAASLVKSLPTTRQGYFWLVPEHFHSPIRQDVVLLRSGENSPGPLAFLAFLKSDQASEIITAYGYRSP